MADIAEKLYITDILKKEKFIKTFVFDDDQLIISDNEDTLQSVFHELYKIILDHNFQISIQKTKL
jgi:hypothetical protein